MLLSARQRKEVEDKVKDWYCGVRRRISTCKACDVHAHNTMLIKNRKFIQDLFPGMTCMDILHSQTGKEIWN
jgi:hypothetical protein